MKLLTSLLIVAALGGSALALRAWLLLPEPPPEVVLQCHCEVHEGEEVEEEELLEEPIVQDYEVSDSNETQVPEVDVEFESTEASPDMLTDSPFDAKSFNSAIGIGGGAGGKFGGRFGGRPRSVSAESYGALPQHGFRWTAQDPAVTFAADVDTAAYANVRRLIQAGQRPPADAVRIEELLNYFPYPEPAFTGDHPLTASVELATCPWNPERRLARVSLRTRAVDRSQRQPSNLVFLLDVSGSMNRPNKLPLLKRALRLLVDQLDGSDRIAIVTYAGRAGLALPPTSGLEKETLLAAIDALQPGGSTAGAAGIRLAYELAQGGLIPGGINRVLLATDGDFNVGISDPAELRALIAEQAQGGVFLTGLGLGGGNLRDDVLEELTNHGNGHYAYLDSLMEARKVLVEELGSTLQVVAQDVKLQVLLDPSRVAAHRLIGYANRRLAHRDFEDDAKDAGELGAGHQVTALLELVPVGADLSSLGDLKALDADDPPPAFDGPGLVQVRVRFQEPGGSPSRLVTADGLDDGRVLATASNNLRFAAAVAWFGQHLRRSGAVHPQDLAQIRALAASALGDDRGGYRAGFLELLDQSRDLLTAR